MPWLARGWEHSVECITHSGRSIVLVMICNLNPNTYLDLWRPQGHTIHSCTVRIILIIRLGKNSWILTNFIMNMNVQNDYVTICSSITRSFPVQSLNTLRSLFFELSYGQTNKQTNRKTRMIALLTRLPSAWVYNLRKLMTKLYRL